MFRILRKNIATGKVTLPPAALRAGTPEGVLGAPEIDSGKCTGCGKCVLACPTQALAMRQETADGRTLCLSYGDCILCGLCGPVCPHQAVSLNGKFERAALTKKALYQELPFSLQECRKDQAFIPGDALPVKRSGTVPFGDCRQGDFAGRLTLEEIGPKLKDRIGRLFGRSLHIREVDAGSCNGCEVEIVNLSNPIYDAERFGVHFVASPRHADMLLVTGPVTRPMELALVKTYEATPSPKLVVACGSCAVSGGIFDGNYAVIGGADRCVPVNVYIPGCPPRPEAILHGIFLALDRSLAMKKD